MNDETQRDLLRSIPRLVGEIEKNGDAFRSYVLSTRRERWVWFVILLFALAGPPRCNGRTLTDTVAGAP